MLSLDNRHHDTLVVKGFERSLQGPRERDAGEPVATQTHAHVAARVAIDRAHLVRHQRARVQP